MIYIQSDYIVRQKIAIHVKMNSRKRLITTQHSVYDIKNDDRLIGSVVMIKIRWRKQFLGQNNLVNLKKLPNLWKLGKHSYKTFETFQSKSLSNTESSP